VKPTSAGLWCIFAAPFSDDPAKRDELVRLLTDARWPWQPQLLHASSIPGGPRTAQVKGKIPRADLAAAIRAALAAPSTAHIELSCSKQFPSNQASIVVDTGRFSAGWDRVPFELRAQLHVDELPSAAAFASWISLCHDLVRVVGGVHAVIPVTAVRHALYDELSLMTTVIDGKLQHPAAPEIKRTQKHRKELGATYVRPPRWGNYLGPTAVTAAGGRDRIAAVVQPAVVAEVGSLLYVQLSADVTDALAPATEHKRQELAKLLAPVMIPDA